MVSNVAQPTFPTEDPNPVIPFAPLPLVAGLIVSGLVSAGCGSGATARPPAEPTATERAEDVRQYQRLRDRTRQAGGQVVRMLHGQQLAQLHGRFTPALAAAVSVEALGRVLAEIGGVPEAVADGVVVRTAAQRVYRAAWPRDANAKLLQTAFDDADRIDLLSLEGAAEPQAGEVDPPAQVIQLPVNGSWLLMWAGRNLAENYHRTVRAQSFATDLVVWQSGATFTGDGTRNEDYWAWGREVFAPCDGVVVSWQGGVPDNRPGDLGMDARSLSNPTGNHVVIETPTGAFVFVAHLRNGNPRFEPGQPVRAGDPLGVCGNSGRSSEPHLHLHAQDAFPAADPRGVPLTIADVVVDEMHADAGAFEPRQGAFLRRRAARPADASAALQRSQ